MVIGENKIKFKQIYATNNSLQKSSQFAFICSNITKKEFLLKVLCIIFNNINDINGIFTESIYIDINHFILLFAIKKGNESYL